MRKRTFLLWGLGLGLAGWALYRARRRLIARWLNLPPPRNDVLVERNLRVVMPDGVALMADHYGPKGGSSPSPTILIRTPYGRWTEAGWFGPAFGFLAQRFAERGYHVIIQNTRGRFDSEGTFEPLIHEAADGLATVEWIAGQPWFDGRMGMWGPSYLAYTTWAVATAAPPQLKAIVPSIALSRGYPVAYREDACALDLALHALFLFDTLGGDTERSLLEEYRRWGRREEILAPAFRHLPLIEADEIVVGRPYPFYRDSFAHPRPDDVYWQAMDHHSLMDQVTAPALLFSGWYDLFLPDVLADYAALRAAGRDPYLTIGPWYHVDLSYLDLLLGESLAWFDAHLRGERTTMREKPVRVYVMGAEEWRELASWPPPASEARYFLQAGGGLAANVPAEGALPDRYRYDPADPTPNLAGPLLFPPAGPVDNRELEARPDVLVYTTAPLSEAVEVVGSPRLVLYVRSTLAHTDFFGRLCDVHPDGRSINLCDGFFRLAPGKGELQPDGTLRLEVELWPTAHRFLAGHRIRLQVSSGAHPRWNRNLGTGEPPGTATTMRPAEQTVYHNRAHPSVLVLPIRV